MLPQYKKSRGQATPRLICSAAQFCQGSGSPWLFWLTLRGRKMATARRIVSAPSRLTSTFHCIECHCISMTKLITGEGYTITVIGLEA